MTEADLAKLTKLLQMTLSDSDGECLVAIRKANAILARYNHNWEDLIAEKIAVSETIDDVHEAVWDDDLNGMLVYLLKTVPKSSSFYDFVESITAQWHRQKWVSPKQYDAIKRACERRSPNGGWRSI